MTRLIDDSIWPDGEVLTEYVICKAVYKINPRRAAILYPKPFVEKLDELIAKRGICTPSLRDLVLRYRSSLLASGNVSKTSISTLDGGENIAVMILGNERTPEIVLHSERQARNTDRDSSPQQFTNGGQRPKPSHPTVTDHLAPVSSSPFSSDARRKRRPLEEMLRIPNLKTKLVRPPPQKSSVLGYSGRNTIPSIEEEAKKLLSGEHRKASVRKVWFSPVEERRRRSIWDPSAIPTKGLLKKRRNESNLLDAPATSENTPQDSQISRELSKDVRECLEKRHQAATHEKPVGNPATSMSNKRQRKREASRERSPGLEHSPPSLKPVDPEREGSTGEQESSKPLTGSHTSVDSEAALSDVSASTGSTHVRKEKQEEKFTLNDHDLSVDESCHTNNDFESGSITSIPSSGQITCKTSSSRRKQKAPQRFQAPLKCESSVGEGRNVWVLSGTESPGSNDVRSESLEVSKQASTPEANSGPDESATVDTSSAPVVLRKRRKSKCTDVCKAPKSSENVYPGQFECPLCSKQYANARALRAHVVRAHREVVEDNEGSPEKKATQPIGKPSGSSITDASLNESDDKDLIVLPSPRTPSSGEIKKGSSSENISDVDVSPSTPSYVRITGGVEDLLSYLICPFCKAIFVEKLSVEKHVGAAHSKLSYCPYDMERDGKCELDELKVKEILAKLMCAYCEHMCTRQSHLRLHQKRVHPSLEARRYDFDKDGKIDLSAYVVRQDFVDLTRLEMTALKSVVCATCKKIFCKPNAVSRHVIAAHKGSATVTWEKNDVIDTAMIGIQRIREVLATLICYECRRAFADPIDLKRHRRKSHKPSPLTESKES